MTDTMTVQEQQIINLDSVVSKVLEEDYNKLLDVLTRDMSPYDVDVTELARRFKSLLSDLQEYDLQIPAKMILACSIILKFKADLLLDDKRLTFNDSDEQEMGELMLDEFVDDDLINEEEAQTFIPLLELPLRRQPKKRVTLGDLKLSFERALLIQLERDERWKNRKDYTIQIDEKDIQKKISQFFEIVQKKINKKDLVRFEELLEQQDVREKVEKFLHILHLEGDRKIECSQEEFFGDIFIKLLKQEIEKKNSSSKKKESTK